MNEVLLSATMNSSCPPSRCQPYAERCVRSVQLIGWPFRQLGQKPQPEMLEHDDPVAVLEVAAVGAESDDWPHGSWPATTFM